LCRKKSLKILFSFTKVICNHFRSQEGDLLKPRNAQRRSSPSAKPPAAT
jgi:hypothetical protein